MRYRTVIGGFNPSTTNRWSGSVGWHIFFDCRRRFQSIYHQPVVWKVTIFTWAARAQVVSIHLPPTGGLEASDEMNEVCLTCRFNPSTTNRWSGRPSPTSSPRRPASSFNPSTTNRWSGSCLVVFRLSASRKVSIHLPPTGGLEALYGRFPRLLPTRFNPSTTNRWSGSDLAC